MSGWQAPAAPGQTATHPEPISRVGLQVCTSGPLGTGCMAQGSNLLLLNPVPCQLSGNNTNSSYLQLSEMTCIKHLVHACQPIYTNVTHYYYYDGLRAPQKEITLKKK